MKSTDSKKNKEERAAVLADFDATLKEMLKEKKVLSFSAPGDNDVLCGRGHVINQHPGNVLFRSIVKATRLDYVMSLKKDKKNFSEVIVHRIRAQDPPGYFLKKDPKTGTWIDIGHKKALTKTRQALRENANIILNEELDRDKQQSKTVSHSTVKTEKNIEKAAIEKIKKSSSKSSGYTPCNNNELETSSTCRLYYSEKIYSSEFMR
jgi:hypothetical protein